MTNLRRSYTIMIAVVSVIIISSSCERSAAGKNAPRNDSTSRSASVAAPVRSVSPDSDDRFWQSAKPKEDLELNSKALAAHLVLCERTRADACLVVHHDRIVQEWYAPTYNPPMFAMSSTKSVTGLLTGMLIDDGRIRSPDVTVCTFIPSWCIGWRAPVTLRHLLTMTSGLPQMRDSSVENRRDKNDYVTHLVPMAQPGTKWAYSNEGVQLLSPILDAAAKEPIQDYARRRLFEPLGMYHTRLGENDHHAWTFMGMATTPRDFARLGLLALHHGMWDGKQIVSADWISQSTTPSQTLNTWYGLLWWIMPQVRGYAMLGAFDTSMYVIPDMDLVIVRMQKFTKTPIREGEYGREGIRLFRSLIRSH